MARVSDDDTMILISLIELNEWEGISDKGCISSGHGVRWTLKSGGGGAESMKESDS